MGEWGGGLRCKGWVLRGNVNVRGKRKTPPLSFFSVSASSFKKRKEKKKGKLDNKALRQSRNIVFRETNRRLEAPEAPFARLVVMEISARKTEYLSK